MWHMTLGELLDAATRRQPDQVFLEISGEKITFSRFQRSARRTAAMFQGMGITKGDRVCLFLPNCPEFIYCWFGLSLLGAISVPINTAYKRDETAYILNNAEASALVAHESLQTVAHEAANLAPSVTHRLLVGDDSTQAGGWTAFNRPSNNQPDLHASPEVAPQDMSMLVYTSGTTGNPKGVRMTHQMYVAAGQGFAHWTQASSEDRFFTCLPFFHANAQYYSTMGALAAGATLVVMDRFSASRFWDQVIESRATVVNFIGMMMPVLAKQPESAKDTENQVRVFYGSPASSRDFLNAFEKRFGTGVIVGFGMTESCYGTIEAIQADRRDGSSGLPRQHPDPRFINEIGIVNEEGVPQGPRTVGEIVIRNPAVTPGYWRNEDQTRETIRDGWLYTGDLGNLDEDGYLYYVDRKKDVIRRRGENISSQEVEGAIKAHPSVLDCAVIGVPSELGEDEVKAYVMPKPDCQIQPEEVVLWCADRLAYFKVPRYIEIRDELPRTPSLRVRKDLLRRERPDLVQGSFDREKAGLHIR